MILGFHPSTKPPRMDCPRVVTAGGCFTRWQNWRRRRLEDGASTRTTTTWARVVAVSGEEVHCHWEAGSQEACDDKRLRLVPSVSDFLLQSTMTRRCACALKKVHNPKALRVHQRDDWIEQERTWYGILLTDEAAVRVSISYRLN